MGVAKRMPFHRPSTPTPQTTLASLLMKWMNAKSMFLVVLITLFIPPLIVLWQIERILIAMTVAIRGLNTAGTLSRQEIDKGIC